jgi:hypothetical protein
MPAAGGECDVATEREQLRERSSENGFTSWYVQNVLDGYVCHPAGRRDGTYAERWFAVASIRSP